MKNAEIALHLVTKEQERRISVRVFVEAVAATETILRELDRTLSEGRLEWYFSALGLGSGRATFTASWQDESSDAISPELAASSSQIVANRFVDGLALLERTAEWPEGFTHAALEAARRLVAVREDGVVDIIIAVDDREPVSLSLQVDRHVQEILGQTYTAIGSVEGAIESVNLTGAPYFVLREHVAGMRIVCSFDRSLLPAVRQAIGRTAIVTGQLTYAEPGRLIAVSSVTSLTQLDNRSTTPLDEILGVAPNFTDGLTVDQFIEWIHDDTEP